MSGRLSSGGYSNSGYSGNEYSGNKYFDNSSSGNKYSYKPNQNSPEYCVDCVVTHDEKHGRNYVWLDVLGHGPVERVWFEEPVGSSKYVLYTTKWWETHCKAVSHGTDLYNAHVKAFVDPKTRFAKMLFMFSDGSLIEGNKEFYQLEQEYYDQHGLC
jgi:hypothetical protein